jgi:hypothetical protein
MAKKIEDLMEKEVKHYTFTTLNSPIATQLIFPVLKQYGLKMDFYTNDGLESRNKRITPDKDTKFHVGMHFQISGKRKYIQKFC